MFPERVPRRVTSQPSSIQRKPPQRRDDRGLSIAERRADHPSGRSMHALHRRPSGARTSMFHQDLARGPFSFDGKYSCAYDERVRPRPFAGVTVQRRPGDDGCPFGHVRHHGVYNATVHRSRNQADGPASASADGTITKTPCGQYGMGEGVIPASSQDGRLGAWIGTF